MYDWGMKLSALVCLIGMAATVRAGEPGLVEDFETGAHGFSSFSAPFRVPTGGVGGDGDGYLEDDNPFESQLGAHTERLDMTGNLPADGVTGYSFWLSELGTEDNIEIHVGIGIGFQNVWLTIEGFDPPTDGWAEFSVDVTDESGWIHIIDFDGGTFADAVAGSDRLVFRHDTAPLEMSPTFTTGNFGLDRITVLPACETPAFVAGAEGISFNDRAFDGFVDARAESSNGVDVDLGLSTFTLEFTTALENIDGSPLSAAAFTVTDTGGSPPGIANVTTADGQTVTLELTDHITLQQRTTIAVSARAVCNPDALLNDSIVIGYLPTNVNQDDCVSPFDLLQFRQYVNGAVPPVGVVLDYIDIDRNEVVSPFDLLAFRQLINGGGNATQTWAGQCLP